MSSNGIAPYGSAVETVILPATFPEITEGTKQNCEPRGWGNYYE